MDQKCILELILKTKKVVGYFSEENIRSALINLSKPMASAKCYGRLVFIRKILCVLTFNSLINHFKGYDLI